VCVCVCACRCVVGEHRYVCVNAEADRSWEEL